MNKDELRTLSNVLNSNDGFEFVFLLLNKLGAWERGFNNNAPDKEVFRNIGRREQGAWLLEQCFKANVKQYSLLMHEKFKEN